MISTVSPFIERTTSPGRVALPSGMFSTRPTRPTTLAAALRAAMACMAPATVPAPPMSIVMSSMPAAGFIEMPPVSKTTPLPISASGFSAPPPRQCMTTTLDGLSDPCPTARSVRMPSVSSAASSRTSTSTPRSRSASRRSAKAVVVRTLAGSFTRSRVRNTPSARARDAAKAASAASGSAIITSTAAAASSGSSSLRVLWSAKE